MAVADSSGNRRLTRQLSLGGMLTAIILLILTAKLYLPTADLALLALTSLGLAIAVIELGIKPALVVYLAAGLLSLAWPGLAAAFPFIIVTGPYPLIRALIDKRSGRIMAIILKLVAGNILIALAAALFAWPDVAALADRYTFFWILMPFAVQAGLLIYDYALSLLIQFYVARVKNEK
ncbi:MAG TPA: hypothetical protein DCM45_01470 [Clostridiales bacterium]|nr:hypothetical protein [Clostridiales bacterium]